MTKKELVDEILKLEKVDSRSNLMQKKNGDLEEVLLGLQGNEKDVQLETNKSAEDMQPKKKKIERDSNIPCRNLTSGRLTYISKKTGLETAWSEFGDEEYIEFSELLTMKSSQPKFLREPWLFVDDEEAVEMLGLKDLYRNVIPIEEVEEFFDLSLNECKKILPSLPKGMRQLISEKARKGIQDGSLSNLQIIRFLENELNLDLISIME